MISLIIINLVGVKCPHVLELGDAHRLWRLRLLVVSRRPVTMVTAAMVTATMVTTAMPTVTMVTLPVVVGIRLGFAARSALRGEGVPGGVSLGYLGRRVDLLVDRLLGRDEPRHGDLR